MIVKIVKDWANPDLKRQTPGHSCSWGDHRFVFDEENEFDLMVVLNRPRKKLEYSVKQGNSWLIMQEPPTEHHEWHKKSFKHFDYVFCAGRGESAKIIPSHGALPWYIEKSYDELVSTKLDKAIKTRSISMITSNLQLLDGHKARYEFFERLQRTTIEIDYFGRGINPIENKYDALYPYKYSIAIENSTTADYWTEKIADCYLSYCVPFYYGCSNISKYFPEGSFVEIDLGRFDYTIDKIKDISTSDYWQSNISSIEEARDLILNKYQIFPFIDEKIKRFCVSDSPKKAKIIPANVASWEKKPSFLSLIKGALRQIFYA